MYCSFEKSFPVVVMTLMLPWPPFNNCQPEQPWDPLLNHSKTWQNLAVCLPAPSVRILQSTSGVKLTLSDQVYLSLSVCVLTRRAWSFGYWSGSSERETQWESPSTGTKPCHQVKSQGVILDADFSCEPHLRNVQLTLYFIIWKSLPECHRLSLEPRLYYLRNWLL